MQAAGARDHRTVIGQKNCFCRHRVCSIYGTCEGQRVKTKLRRTFAEIGRNWSTAVRQTSGSAESWPSLTIIRLSEGSGIPYLATPRVCPWDRGHCLLSSHMCIASEPSPSPIHFRNGPRSVPAVKTRRRYFC